MKLLPSLLASGTLATLFDQQDCPEDGQIRCTRIYQPACGNDGITYGSACMAKYAFCGGESLTGIAYTGTCMENDASLENTETEEVKETKEVEETEEIEEQESCVFRCTKDFSPVCGSDNTTYGNDCELKTSNCESRIEIRKSHDGECKEPDYSEQEKDCPISCKNASAGKKVCGSDGKTYNSSCHLKKANCKSKDEITRISGGKCNKNKMENDFIQTPDVEEAECPTFCNRMMAPVCGSDYTTYSNECVMKTVGCEEPERNLSKLHDRACECPEYCHKMLNQVCGQDNQVYASPCELKRAACESGQEIALKNFGVCEISAKLIEPENIHLKLAANKPCACTREFSLTCGTDGNTYANSCLLGCAGTEISRYCDCKYENCPLNDFGFGGFGGLFGDDFAEESSEESPVYENEPEMFGEMENDVAPVEPTCSKICARMYAPVCGWSELHGYVTYSNPCMMDVISCEAGENAVESKKSVCGQKANGVTRYFRTGCVAGESNANIVDDSECEEKEDREMQMDVFVTQEEEEEEEESKETKKRGNRKGGRNNDIWSSLADFGWGRFGRKRRQVNN